MSLLECIVVLAILCILMGVLLGGIQRVRSSAAKAQCQSQLRQLEMAQHAFLAKRGHFPEGLQYTTKTPNARGLGLSWPSQVLPELEQEPIWHEVHNAHAVDPVGNAEIHEVVGERKIPLFQCPADSRSIGQLDGHREWGLLNYLGVAGTGLLDNDGLCHFDLKLRPADIQDGLSNTLHLGERPTARFGIHSGWYATWGKNFAYGAQLLPVNAPGISFSFRERCLGSELNFYQGKPDSTCDLNHFWSLHPGGANFAFADGSVRFLRYSANSVIAALATRSGGESNLVFE